MSTPPMWTRLRNAYINPPKPRPAVSLIKNPKARLRDLKPILRPNEKARAPTVFNLIRPSVIWRASEIREHKTKRRQQPHMRDWRMPVTILAGKDALDKPTMSFVRMNVAHRDMKDIERAGGLEAKMISSASKNFSTSGKLLRNALFQQLYRMRDERESLRNLHTPSNDEPDHQSRPGQPALASQAETPQIANEARQESLLSLEAPKQSKKAPKVAA